MAHIANYDLSGGSTIVVAGTSVSNIRFQYHVNGGSPGQKVYLCPICSEDDITYSEILKGSKTPFQFKIVGDGGSSSRILSIGSAYVSLKILCDDCTGTLNVSTYQDEGGYTPPDPLPIPIDLYDLTGLGRSSEDIDTWLNSLNALGLSNQLLIITGNDSPTSASLDARTEMGLRYVIIENE